MTAGKGEGVSGTTRESWDLEKVHLHMVITFGFGWHMHSRVSQFIAFAVYKKKECRVVGKGFSNQQPIV